MGEVLPVFVESVAALSLLQPTAVHSSVASIAERAKHERREWRVMSLRCEKIVRQ